MLLGSERVWGLWCYGRGMLSLFDPLMLRGLTLRNRVGMSPMCMYQARGGFVSDWHRVHYPTRAVGGVGLVIVEATAVEARGVISPGDLGIWSDDHVEGLSELVRLIGQHGAAPAIQIAHAGRKSGGIEWEGEEVLDPIGPMAEAFTEKRALPRSMDEREIARVRDAFVTAARRAVAAGFAAIEIHMAHGYLLHSFLSPITNRREDGWGGSFSNRLRFPMLVVEGVRRVMPVEMPLLVRISARDPEPGGWTVEDSALLATELKRRGVDMVDCSSGGATPAGWTNGHPHYQVGLAEHVRRESGIATAAVGVITEAARADELIKRGSCDVVLLGRELLRNPYWTLGAMKSLGVAKPDWPRPYRSAWEG